MPWGRRDFFLAKPVGGLRGQNIPDGAFFLKQRVVLTNPLLRLPRALCEEQQQAEK